MALKRLSIYVIGITLGVNNLLSSVCISLFFGALKLFVFYFFVFLVKISRLYSFI